MTDDLDSPPGSYDDGPDPMLAELIALHEMCETISSLAILCDGRPDHHCLNITAASIRDLAKAVPKNLSAFFAQQRAAEVVDATQMIELRALVREIDEIMRQPADALDRIKQIDFALMKRDGIVMRLRAGDGDWSRANANLIAATPGLYAAAEVVEDFLLDFDNGLGPDVGRLRAVIPALRKARGEPE